MVQSLPLVERAYQLARSGQYATISAIKAQLKTEQYVNVDRHMQGAAILRDLRRLCAAARAPHSRSQA